MFPPIEELVSHRGNMLLLNRVISATPESIQVEAKIDENAWYADTQGAMPAWIGIELMAQAIAALAGLTGHIANTPPKQGLLLGARSFTAHKSAFFGNETLLVTAREVFQDASGLGAFDARIEQAGEIVAEATLKVFEPADFKTFMEHAT